MQDDHTRSEADLLAEELELFRYLLEEEGVVFTNQRQIPRRAPSAVVPLSLAQERMWFLDQMQPGNPAANIPFVVRLSGRLDVEAFRRSLNAVVQRHEALRTTFDTAGGQPQQRIAPALTLPLDLVDLRGLTPSDQEAAVRRLVREHARHAFDLAHGPLLHTRLLQRGDGDFLLLVTMHHIISDAWSVGVMLRECATCYAAYAAGEPLPLPELPVQYPDFAVWQRDWLERPDESGTSPLQRQLSYWKGQLAGLPAALELPTDRPRPPAQTFVGAKHRFAVPPPLTAGLHELSQREGASLFMTLLATFQVLLARWSGQDDIAVGSPIANRTRPEIEGLIGFFVNTLVLRGDLSGNPTFRELLARVRQTTLDAYDHQDLPFERLVEELRPPRDLSRTPLFQVMLVLQNAPLPEIELGGLTLRNQPFENATVQFDLEFGLVENEGGINVQIDYNIDLYDAATIVRMAGHFLTLLAAVVADPDRRIRLLPMLTEAERRRFEAWNRAPWPLPAPHCLHELVARQAARTPGATALVVGEQRLSYRELDSRANRLAHLLRGLGVGPEQCVGVCMTRTAELPIAILAVHKAGGAYVPLDPNYPPDRIAFMLADSQAAVLLTTSATQVELPFQGTTIDLTADADTIARLPETAPQTAVTPENLAYLIYTSGSTGRPKGVAIAHRNAAARLAWAHTTYSPAQLAGVLAATSVCFDLSVFELFVPLSSGGTVILAANALALPTLPAAGEVTLVNTVPSAMAALLSSGGLPASVSTVNLAGEPLPLPLAQQIYAQTAATAVYNLYGPSEDTTYSTGALIPRDATSITIGRPLPHTQAHLLDRALQPVPIGAVGELYLSGAGIARGYYGRPDLTAERFVPKPFGAGEEREPRTKNQEPSSGNSTRNTQHSQLYKTGDLARFRPDGTLEYLGRIDHQVKLRGFRIELGEIETALRRHPDLRDVVVTAREDGGDKRIVAYVVLTQEPRTENQEPDAENAELNTQNAKLRTYLQGSLPDYMVPSAFVVLDALPLTPNGKVDRKALPAPDGARPELGRAYAAPRTPTESELAALWSDVLHVPQVGIHDNFFELGGHSLLATQLVSRVREAFGVGLPLSELFAAPTVAQQAVLIETRPAGSAGPAIQSPPLLPVEHSNLQPLSFSQERLWFLSQLQPDSPLYNVASVVRLSGPLDQATLRRSFEAIIQRHEVLRTTFTTVDQQPVQLIAPEAPLALELLDFRRLPPEQRHAAIQQAAETELGRPFDLARGPLVRAALLQGDDEAFLLLVTLHHIVSDGWSIGVMTREFAVLYAAFAAGRPPALPPLPIQYADYAAWQRGWLDQPDEAGTSPLQRQLSYWKGQLAGAPAALELPTDRPRPLFQTYSGAAHRFAIPPALTAGLHELSQREGASLFMTLLATFQVLLARWSGQEDITVGSPIANRTRPEIEPLIGCFINTLVLRGDLSGDPSFRELLARVRETTLAAYDHQDLPFERLVEELKPPRDLSRTPLFQVMLVLQNAPMPALDLHGLALQSQPFDITTAKFDLELSLTEVGGELQAVLAYNTDLYDAATIVRMAGHFQTLLSSAVADPGRPIRRLALLPEAERELLLTGWNATARPLPAALCLHDLVAQQAERTPDSVALIAGEETLSFRALESRANRLAHLLRAHGVGPERCVGICITRTADLLIAVLAVHKAGGAYVPLDPAYPPERLAIMLADSAASVVLTTSATQADLPFEGTLIDLTAPATAETIAAQPADPPHTGVTPDSLAYVLFTSGSTGRPKGVQISHRALVNFLCSMQREPGLTERDTLLAVTTLAFDISCLELFLPLLVGARIVLADRAMASDGARLAEAVEHTGATVMQATPATWRMLLDAGWPGSPRLTVLSGGEALPRELADRLRARCARVWNLYGPTETTVWSTLAAVADGAAALTSIGRPIDNTLIYILDPHMQPTPVNVPGELYIGGTGLARGYIGRPDLTAERFVPNPFGAAACGLGDAERNTQHATRNTPSPRLYRTGDLCRWLPDGSLDFLGRADHQIKVRGFRIELGEIESVLRRHPTVSDAVVVVREDQPGDKRIVAYIVPHEPRTQNQEPDAESAERKTQNATLRTYLQGSLPEYMVPTAFVMLSALPLTPNGKVDRKALPAPDRARPDLERAFVAPRSPAEAALAALWSAVLGAPQVGIHDNFFELGGHSLLATQLVSRIRETLRVDLPLRELFAAPTVAQQAALVEQRRAASGAHLASGTPLVVAEPGSLRPLSFSQERLWFLSQLEPDSPMYNIVSAVRLSGPLDQATLRRSFEAIIARHAVLRTSFITVDQRPVQQIAPEAPLALELLDFRPLPEAERGAAVQQAAVAEARRPFDLARGPLVRAALLQRDDEEFLLLVTMHHIVSDGWSVGVMTREFAALYAAFAAGKPPALPPLPVQYADYATWQRGWLEQPDTSGTSPLQRQLSYWKDQLAGAPAALELPTDRPRPPVQTFVGAKHWFEIPPVLTASLHQLGQREGASLFMTLLAAFQVLLARYSGQDDIVVGTPIANRTRPEIEGLIGCFINMLVLRGDLSGNPSFRELLARVRQTTLAAYDHQDLPFERLVEELKPPRDLSRSPLFQVMLVLQNAPMPALDLHGLTLQSQALGVETAKFDLELGLVEFGGGLSAQISYNIDLFDAETIARMAGHFQTLLAGVAAAPDQPVRHLPMLTEAERHTFAEWNRPAWPLPAPRCLHELVARQADSTPDAAALVVGEQRLSYRELDSRASRLAHLLQAHGVGPERCVGVCMTRTAELVVAVLAVLKAGGAYIPLDPAYPPERIAFMLADSQAAVLLTTGATAVELPFQGTVLDLTADADRIARLPETAPQTAVTPENLAYLIYTSGSTGRPKGVAIAHRTAAARIAWAQATYSPAQLAGVLAATSVCFDLSIFELFAPLSSGGTVILAENALALPTLPAAHAVTLVNTVPSAMAALLRDGGSLPPGVSTVNLAGEPLPLPLVQQIYTQTNATQVYNLYGPSEDTTYSTGALIPRDASSVSIGRPLPHTQTHLLDRHGQPVPIGVVGEICLGGAGITRGYYARPDLTAERFVPNPFGAGGWRLAAGEQHQEPDGATSVSGNSKRNTQHSQLYKTGDLARFRPDGALEYLGRIDHQVKLRGFRIELGEIEAALRRHPDLRDVVVTARADGGDTRIVAYVVLTQEPRTQNQEPDAESAELKTQHATLRTYLQGSLPEYMVPSAFVVLDALPLTPNGKVDRKALPAPEATRPELEHAFVAPRSPVEAALAALWASVLGADRVGVYDNFFELGGHSLLATQLVSRVRDALGAELPLRELFAAPTVAQQAALIEGRRRLADRTATAPPVAAGQGSVRPLSFSQERLWFLDQLEPGSPLYNIISAVRLTGRLDVDALRRSFETIIARHAVLRTTFALVDGQPVQQIAPEVPLALEVEDLRALPADRREAAIRIAAGEEVQRSFDLARGPLVRTRLIRIDEADWLLLVTTHHIISDGWSVGVMTREFAALYADYAAGKPPALPPLPIQYADYAAWQRGWLDRPDESGTSPLQRQLSYWKDQLAGAPAALALPTDRQRPPAQTSNGAFHRFAVPPALTAGLHQLGQREGASLFMTLLAAFQVLLARYSGQDDITVGTPIANRTRPEIEPLIGCFINMLVLRGDLSGDPSFRTLLRRVRQTTLAAYDHQDLPFERLVEELKPPRDLSRTPLFQVLLALQNAPMPAVALADVTLRSQPVEMTTAKFDLELGLVENNGGLSAQIDYNTDLFDADTIARMAEHFLTLLTAAVADPAAPISRLALLGATERAALLALHQTGGPFSEQVCIHQLFEERAAHMPDAPALEWDGQRLSYRELNERANRLAHHLRAIGVRLEDRVGICMERTGDLIVGLLGILKAGAAYVPLDPAYPPERLLFMAEDAGVRVLLTRQAGETPWFGGASVDLAADWPAISQRPASNPAVELGSQQLAYVIYTSGSTGRPKGVLVEHRSLVNYIEATRDFCAIGEGDRVLQFTSISFDASAEEVYTALTSGGTLVLRSEQMIETVETFLRTCAEWQISVIGLPTAFWHELVARMAAGGLALPPTTHTMIIGGEEAQPERVEQWQRIVGPQVRLINSYGPTETTVSATVAEVPAVAPAHRPAATAIGRPVRNLTAYVLDRHLDPMPIGVPGELYIGGAGVARGYLGRPELTAERFVPNPFAVAGAGEEREEPRTKNQEPSLGNSTRNTQHTTLYRTGDLVRLLPDGTIEYLGRIDQQVKLRGFRIELGEIETALRAHPEVYDAVVLARSDSSGDKHLVAYLVPQEPRTENQEPDTESAELKTQNAKLRTYLRGSLPDYMVPSAFVVLDALPLTPSGKLDRRALPAPEDSSPELERAFVAPRSPAETLLAALWSDILHIPRVGVEDNFFELGGHSLRATQLVSRIREVFQVELPLRELFAAPTVAQQAALVERQRAQAGLRVADAAPLLHRERSGPPPLSFAQQRLWFLDQLQPDSPLYNIPAFVRLSGPLDRDALRRSFETIIGRHEVLRTTFALADDQPIQLIAPALPLALESLDFRLLPPEDRDATIEQATADEVRRPFDLAGGPLIRAALFQRDDEEFLLLVTMHHIVSDGWSIGVMTREFAALYAAYAAGQTPQLPDLPVQYADYALWQRDWLDRPDEAGISPLQRQLSYWKDQLAGLPAAIELPTDRPRPPVQTFSGATHMFVVPPALTAGLHRLGQREGASLFMTLLAAFQVLLARWSGQDDIAVGTPIANRTRPEIEPLIGFFVNTLVLRGDLSGDPSFRQLLGRVRETTLGAYDHQDLPFERLVEELKPPRDLSRSPLFQVMLVLQNVPMPAVDLADLTLQSLPIATAAVKFDLELGLVEIGGQLNAQIDYNTDLFDAATIAHMAGHFLTLLAGVVADPAAPIGRLPMLTEAERYTFAEWNRPAWPLPAPRCLHELVAQQAARTPDSTALVVVEERLSYRELDTRASRLAHLLRGLGVGPERCVGVCLPRGVDLVVAILAVLKAGGAYVPLDPAYPPERVAFMLADSQAAVLLTTGAIQIELPFQGTTIDLAADADTIARLPETAPPTAVTPENLAYLIYTSGSTGRPKGVAIAHRTAAARIAWAHTTYSPAQLAGVLASTSVCFDLSIFELFAPLSSGGTVILAANALTLPTLPAAGAVTLVNTVPSAMAALLRDGGSLPPGVSTVNLAGEPLPLPLVQQIYTQTNATQVYNLYGPSEDTTYSTGALIPRDATSITIGRPLPHTQVFLLDRHGQPVPIGVIGELYLSGAGITRGYYARPDLTAERFVPNPFAERLVGSSWLYRTGDLARFRPDGTLDYLGRIDHQVKLRGFRIELGEIEAALRRHPDLRDVVVAAREDGGDTRIVAYVVLAQEPRTQNQEPDAQSAELKTQHAKLRTYLQGSLPDYMVPSAFVVLDALPLTPNGKVDRKALPAPEGGRAELEHAYIAPRTATEEQVAALWREVLRQERVGVHDNFFELGGHSLLATQLIVRLRAAFRIDLPIQRLFSAPTVAGVAEIIDAFRWAAQGSVPADIADQEIVEGDI